MRELEFIKMDKMIFHKESTIGSIEKTGEIGSTSKGVPMSDVRLDSSKDVIAFLKLLAEESINVSRESMGDPAQEIIQKGMRRDTKIFDHITEIDEELPGGEIENTQPPSEEEESAPKDEPEHLEVSLDSITDSIKQLRSGRSVDDSRIRDEMRTYYDRIDEAERQALLAFMRAFAGILTGTLTGKEAPDPSDSPYTVSMSTLDVEEELPPKQQPQSDEVEDFNFEEEEEDPEDTAPPVRVGASQSLSEIRKKIRTLMESK